MVAIIPGHEYEVSNKKNPADKQIIRLLGFEYKPDDKNKPEQRKEVVSTYAGVPALCLLNAVVDRIAHLQGVLPCNENSEVITRLNQAVKYLTGATAEGIPAIGIIEPGYFYTLPMLNAELAIEGEPIPLQFIRNVQDGDGNLILVMDGTTNEEILGLLLNKMEETEDRGSPESTNNFNWGYARKLIADSILWLNLRTQNRQLWGMEGTANPI